MTNTSIIIQSQTMQPAQCSHNTGTLHWNVHTHYTLTFRFYGSFKRYLSHANGQKQRQCYSKLTRCTNQPPPHIILSHNHLDDSRNKTEENPHPVIKTPLVTRPYEYRPIKPWGSIMGQCKTVSLKLTQGRQTCQPYQGITQQRWQPLAH